MKSNISVKRIICFLLAVMMLLAAVGCKESKKSNKKKVVVRDKVIVRDNGDNNTSSVNSDDSTFDNNNYVPTTTRGKRALIKAEEEEETVSFDELHKETFKPEFESKNVAWDGPEEYVKVYSTATDKNGASKVTLEKAQEVVYLKEISVPTGYTIDANSYNVSLNIGKTNLIFFQ